MWPSRELPRRRHSGARRGPAGCAPRPLDTVGYVSSEPWELSGGGGSSSPTMLAVRRSTRCTASRRLDPLFTRTSWATMPTVRSIVSSRCITPSRAGTPGRASHGERIGGARPGRIADHVPYDRNHVGPLGREAGVPPVKGPDATGPAPKYDPDTEAAALAELDGFTATFQKAEAKRGKARDALHAAMTRHYDAGAPPSEPAAHTPYDRNHRHRIVKAAHAPGRSPTKA